MELDQALIRTVVLATAACNNSSAEAVTHLLTRQADTCAVEDGRPLPAFERRETRVYYRVNLATGTAARIDPASVVPLPDRVTARIDNGRLEVKNTSGGVMIDADARGAHDLAWTLERDGILYVSLYRDDVQTYQALRLSGAPRVDTLWCRSVPNEGTRGAVATAHGPLLVITPKALVAVRPEDGATSWEMPRDDSGGPFAVLEAGAEWIACDTDITVMERETGHVRWRKAFPPHTFVDCGLAGGRVMFASRTCGRHECVPAEHGAVDVATGSPTFVDAASGWRSLVDVDGQRVLVATARGVALVDTRTGVLGAELAVASAARATLVGERLADGEVVLRDQNQTIDITIHPLAVRWVVSGGYVKRIGAHLVAVRNDLAAGSALIVVIDPKTGSERAIPLSPIPPPPSMGAYEFGGATVLGSAGDEIDVAMEFGYETR